MVKYGDELLVPSYVLVSDETNVTIPFDTMTFVAFILALPL
jgi:hypothetical protein